MIPDIRSFPFHKPTIWKIKRFLKNYYKKYLKPNEIYAKVYEISQK